MISHLFDHSFLGTLALVIMGLNEQRVEVVDYVSKAPCERVRSSPGSADHLAILTIDVLKSRCRHRLQ